MSLNPSHWRGVFDTTSSDKVCQVLAAGRWFFPVTPVSSTNETGHHNITEILVKLVLNTPLLRTTSIYDNVDSGFYFHYCICWLFFMKWNRNLVNVEQMWWFQDQFPGILPIFGMLFSVFFLFFAGIVWTMVRVKTYIYYLVCLYL